jgi:hypothetical protein
MVAWHQIKVLPDKQGRWYVPLDSLSFLMSMHVTQGTKESITGEHDDVLLFFLCHSAQGTKESGAATVAGILV